MIQQNPNHPHGALLSRRQFVKLGAVGGAVIALGTWGIAHWLQGRREHVLDHLAWTREAHLSLEDRIARQFHYLRLDRAGIRAFAQDYERHFGRVSRFRRPYDDPFHRYLLSTDFFVNGADESKLVRYVLFYDPYVSPCWNPCLLNSA
jgi:hypothetical protein